MQLHFFFKPLSSVPSNFSIQRHFALVFLLLIISRFFIYFHQTNGQVKFEERVINKGTANPVVYDVQLQIEIGEG
jgi:hypothetical protein